MPLFYSNVTNSNNRNNLYSHNSTLSEQPSFSNMIKSSEKVEAEEYKTSRLMNRENSEIVNGESLPRAEPTRRIGATSTSKKSRPDSPVILAVARVEALQHGIMNRLEKLENLLLLLLLILTLLVMKMYN